MLDWPHTGRLRKKDNLMTGEGESLVLNKLFNNLLCIPSYFITFEKIKPSPFTSLWCASVFVDVR
jgi:hypothetical protein